MNIGVKKTDTHEGVTVKALLDSGVTELFMSKEYAQRRDFKLMKLEKPIIVKNVDRIGNSGGAITHEVKVNIYFKGHMK